MHKTQNKEKSIHDERLAGIDPERLAALTEFAKELSEAPQDHKMSTLLSIHQRAAENHITFSDAERNLLIEILTEHMTPEEKHRVSIIKNLSGKIFAQ